MKTKVVHVKAYTRKYPKKKAPKVVTHVRSILRKHGGEMKIADLIKKSQTKSISKKMIEDAIILMKRDGILYSPGKGEMKFVK